MSSLRVFTPVAVVVAAALFPHPGPIYAQVAGPAGKLAIAASKWDEAKAALARYHQEFPQAVTSTIQEEELRRAKTRAGGKNDWGCEAELVATRQRNASEKKDVNGALSDAEVALKDAEATARGLSPLPWTGADASAMKTAIKAARALDVLVDSPKTSASAEGLAKLARQAEAYAASLPPSIGAVRPTSLVPRTVFVPCINLTVTIPVKD